MPNQHKNKVVYNGTTLIDLTADTITASALMQGFTAHDASGAPITGTATGGSMVIRDEQDSHGGTVRSITAGSVVQGTKAITENGTYDVAAFADASVNVPAPEPELQAKTATPSTSQQVITADSGYDGLSQVTVSAMPSGSATTPTTSITANPSISVNNTTGLITASVSGSKSVTPSVSAGYVSSGTAGTVSVSGSNTSQLTTQAAKTVTPSTSSQTAVAAGRYTTGAVTVAAMPSGTAGTPTATKGTVSNHAISVTPSVTNTTGYITGGTKSGTAVTVSASELVSGTLEVTESGTYDVTNYASADVSVSGGATNFVQGTFTTSSTTGSAQTIDIPYTGAGYPIIAHVEVTGGVNNESNTEWYDAIRRFSVGLWHMSKTNPNTGFKNYDTGVITVRLKTSTTDASQSSFDNNASYYYAQPYGAGSYAIYDVVTFTSKTQLSVFVSDSGTRGLMPSISYSYYIVYSE